MNRCEKEEQKTGAEFKIPTPIEGVDFYTDTLQSHTILIELIVPGLVESGSSEQACADAVRKFRAGEIDGTASAVYNETIKKIKLCWDTDAPFDQDAWQKSKLLELGVHKDGTSLRPWEKERPKSETKLSDFVGSPSWWITTLRQLKATSANIFHSLQHHAKS